MAIIKCKMCGGELNIADNATIGTCEYCGTKQTLPRHNNDKKNNLYERANHFRRNNEYDKAMAIFESILNEDTTDAESYWSLVLCKYGIEYVEDPATHKRVPTVNRAQFTSVLADEDYKSAIKYADAAQRSIYEEEARAIDAIQKGILAISQKEKPFDVFICYKETDASGKRTHDSVIANDIYHQLTQEGLKVFYAAITLEDKLGTAYEPYIFAALNSAKVMLVVGTKPEYFNAVWVKNEWSRFIKLMKDNRSKLLIPCYRDMDAYDLPDEFSHLQAQDMSKLGFMQDIIRGIKKIAGPQESEKQGTTVVREPIISPAAGATNVDPLLKRVFIFLEDRDYDSANEYCEKVLDIDPENAQAYLGKLLADCRVAKVDSLAYQSNPFEKNSNYLKVCRYGDEELVEKLRGFNKKIGERNEENRKNNLYETACNRMKNAKSVSDYLSASDAFDPVINYKDSKELKDKCLKLAEETRVKFQYLDAKGRIEKDTVDELEKAIVILESIIEYEDAKKLVKECKDRIVVIQKDDIYNHAVKLSKGKTLFDQEKAIEEFNKIPGWKDADKMIGVCEKHIDIINTSRKNAELAAKKRMKTVKTAVPVTAGVLVVLIVFFSLLNNLIIPAIKYNKAVGLMEDGKYPEAIEAFVALGDHKDSEKKITECYKGIAETDYQAAVALMEEGKYTEAIEAFKALDDYKDSDEKAIECNQAPLLEKYDAAVKLMEEGKYEEAAELFDELNKFKDSEEKANKCRIAMKNNNAITLGKYEQDNNTDNGKEDIEWIVLKEDGNKALVLSKYALDCKPFNTELKAVTWGNSTIRGWLNDDFVKAAFSEDELKAVLTTKVTAGADKKTEDKIFLLSSSEADKYFSSNDERVCQPTEFTKANNATDNNSNCTWWLRIDDKSHNNAPYISLTGNIYATGSSGFPVDGGTEDAVSPSVRPAMWVDLTKIG